ncbi:MAG: hypothetical protein KAX20_07960, partial [Candidatus Omnitrophica bacterium]|nr:hypothetical protein [Candidatus Omnitrophota bacterium]
METLRYIIILASLIIFPLTSFAGQKVGLNNVINKFEKEIISYVKTREYRKAIISSANYEQELVSRYELPSFQMDLFRSEADHISFHSSFIGWKQVGLKELGIPEWLPMMGFNILLALEGKVENDRFILLSMDMGKIEQRMGIAKQDKKELSDQELLLFATVMAGNFGVVKKQEFKTIGDHRVLVLNIGSPMGESPVTMVNLSHGKRFYAFLLISSLRNRQNNEKKFLELIKTVDFKYKLPNEVKIKKIRKKCSDRPASILQCVAQLSIIGEYNSATEELSRLRILLNQLMPKPFIKRNVAKYPAYGVSLANPDEKKWKLSIEEAGAVAQLLLMDKWSVKEEGIVILILDTILAYGPQAAKALEDEEETKQFLIGGGRASALSLGNIESERFTPVVDFQIK